MSEQPSKLYVQMEEDDRFAVELSLYKTGDQFQEHYPYALRGAEYRCESCQTHLVLFYSREDLPLTWAEKHGFQPFVIDEDDTGIANCLPCFLTQGWFALYSTEDAAVEANDDGNGKHRVA